MALKAQQEPHCPWFFTWEEGMREEGGRTRRRVRRGGVKRGEGREEGRGVGREDKEDKVNTFTNGAPPEM